MIRHKRLRPPSHDYPADEWNVIEKGFRPEFLAQVESIMALGTVISACAGAPRKAVPTSRTPP
jgi:alpha,alpha-trehalose phosphorylase